MYSKGKDMAAKLEGVKEGDKLVRVRYYRDGVPNRTVIEVRRVVGDRVQVGNGGRFRISTGNELGGEKGVKSFVRFPDPGELEELAAEEAKRVEDAAVEWRRQVEAKKQQDPHGYLADQLANADWSRLTLEQLQQIAAWLDAAE